MYSKQEIIWNDDFITGLSEIDEQHMILVNTFNQAITKLSADNSSEMLNRITQDLLAYALYHFETEEALMQQYNYIETNNNLMSQHLNEHRSFSAKVLAIRNDIHDGNKPDIEVLLGFLYDWVLHHIKQVDKDLARWLLKQPGFTQQ